MFVYQTAKMQVIIISRWLHSRAPPSASVPCPFLFTFLLLCNTTYLSAFVVYHHSWCVVPSCLGVLWAGFSRHLVPCSSSTYKLRPSDHFPCLQFVTFILYISRTRRPLPLLRIKCQQVHRTQPASLLRKLNKKRLTANMRQARIFLHRYPFNLLSLRLRSLLCMHLQLHLLINHDLRLHPTSDFSCSGPGSSFHSHSHSDHLEHSLV